MYTRKCEYCDQEGIEIRQGKRTGKYYAVNPDGSFHQCVNYNQDNKNSDNANSISNIETTSQHSKVEITTAGDILDEKNIENARWFIDGLNLRLVGKRIDLVIKNKENSFQ